MISIINYDSSNLNNVLKAFLSFGYKTKIVTKPKELYESMGVVLPGVGAYGAAMKSLARSGFKDALKEFIGDGKPFLGICLGLQLLFESSTEFGYTEGLGVVKGEVIRFDLGESVPHIGWNEVKVNGESKILKGIEEIDGRGSYFYFANSYYANPKDKSVIRGVSKHEIEFASVIEYKNIYATQFHPEKSQTKGLKIIKNFGQICLK